MYDELLCHFRPVLPEGYDDFGGEASRVQAAIDQFGR